MPSSSKSSTSASSAATSLKGCAESGTTMTNNNTATTMARTECSPPGTSKLFENAEYRAKLTRDFLSWHAAQSSKVHALYQYIAEGRQELYRAFLSVLPEDFPLQELGIFDLTGLTMFATLMREYIPHEQPAPKPPEWVGIPEQGKQVAKQSNGLVKEEAVEEEVEEIETKWKEWAKWNSMLPPDFPMERFGIRDMKGLKFLALVMQDAAKFHVPNSKSAQQRLTEGNQKGTKALAEISELKSAVESGNTTPMGTLLMYSQMRAIEEQCYLEMIRELPSGIPLDRLGIRDLKSLQQFASLMAGMSKLGIKCPPSFQLNCGSLKEWDEIHKQRQEERKAEMEKQMLKKTSTSRKQQQKSNVKSTESTGGERSKTMDSKKTTKSTATNSMDATKVATKSKKCTDNSSNGKAVRRCSK